MDLQKRFKDNGDGTITDLETKLMWKQTDSFQDTSKWLNWYRSKEYLMKMGVDKFAGHNDWRMPTLEEAESLCRSVAIIDHGSIIENTSIKLLLKQLNKEVFILDSLQPLQHCPELSDYKIKLVDEHCLEVVVEKGQLLNTLFKDLSAQQIQIVSMRNKANRLEELFLSLVNSDAGVVS